MSVPPAVCGAVGLYLFASSSDRHRERGWHIVGALVVALGGLVGVVGSVSNAAKYASLCVFLFGSYVPPPLTVAWLSGNTPTAGKRALVVGANGLGNLAGAIGSQLYRAEYAPGYKTAAGGDVGIRRCCPHRLCSVSLHTVGGERAQGGH